MITSMVVGGRSAIPFLLRDLSQVKGRDRTGPKEALKTNYGERQTVLVVDDECRIADSVVEILNRNGFDAIAKYSGKAAMEYAEQGCPDIIVSDVMMPECNGVELAMAIRSRCPDTRILLFSGNAATSNLLDHASQDGHSFELLPKPVHPVQLLNALTNKG